MYHYEKVASSSLEEAKGILTDIYDENPSHWPNGLYPEQMDGGLYLVRQASTNDPVGFVGWQERIEDFKKVGYYSVGIKKEHRRSGFAKAAVKKLIQEKSAKVDKVKALILEDNTPSIGLAEKLDVEIDLEKQAMEKQALTKLISKSSPTSGGLVGAGLGALSGPLESDMMGFDDSGTHLTTLLNAVTGGAIGMGGGLAAKAMRTPTGTVMGMVPETAAKAGIATGAGTALLGWPIKTGLVGVFDELQKGRKEQSALMDKKLDVAEHERETASMLSPYEVDPETGEKRVKPFYAAAGVGAGALGTGAVFAMVLNALRDKNKITIDQNQKKDPDVVSVDIPKDKLSDKFYTSLNRDMLFSTPEEKKERLKELLDEARDGELEKESSATGLDKIDLTEVLKYVLEAGLENQVDVKRLAAGDPQQLEALLAGMGEKSAGFEKQAFAAIGKGLLGLGRHANKVSAGIGKHINPFNAQSKLFSKGMGNYAKQYALGHAGLYGADATGLSEKLGDGNWGNRFGSYLISPFKDAARDFRGGNYGAAAMNALYAPLHLAFNATGMAALGKHGLRQGGKLLAGAGGKLAQGTMGNTARANELFRLSQASAGNAKRLASKGIKFNSGGNLTLGSKLSNPHLIQGTSNMYMTPLQQLGQGMHRLGRGMYNTNIARLSSDTGVANLLRGYGQTLGGTGKFGSGLGNLFAAYGTFSPGAMRSVLNKGDLGRKYLNSGWARNAITGPTSASLMGSLGLSHALLGDDGQTSRWSRNNRYNDWLNDQYQNLESQAQDIQNEESQLLNNPDITAMILQLLGLQDGGPYDGGSGVGGWQANT